MITARLFAPQGAGTNRQEPTLSRPIATPTGSPPLWSAVPIPGQPRQGGRSTWSPYGTSGQAPHRTYRSPHFTIVGATEGWLPRLFYEPHGPLPFLKTLLGPPRKQAAPKTRPRTVPQSASSTPTTGGTACARPRGAYPASGISISQVRPWLRQGFRDTPTCLRPTAWVQVRRYLPSGGNNSSVLSLPEDPSTTPAASTVAQ
jgi:hypothetical protein